jgi:N-dimethylarginine dimethylaminohydrolase
MVTRLRTVVVRRPDASFETADPRRWGYSAKPDLDAAEAEHDALVSMLRESGVEVRYHDAALPGLADSIFVHDPVIVTDRGTVVLRMGKELRRGEEGALGAALENMGIPILGTMQPPATAEGGDLLWIRPDWLAVGQGFRTNSEGLRQLRSILEPLGVQTEPVDLPYFRGPESCLHLMSLISLLDEDLAIVYPKLLPVPLWRHLKEEGFEFVEVPEDEFDRMAPNVLAIAPRYCIMLEGNPVTQKRLQEAGCRVRTYRGTEISLKAEGGATCLTRPVLRRT